MNEVIYFAQGHERRSANVSISNAELDFLLNHCNGTADVVIVKKLVKMIAVLYYKIPKIAITK